MDNRFDSMKIRNGKTVSKHRFVWNEGNKEHKIKFNDYFEPGAWFTVKHDNLSMLDLWKEVRFMNESNKENKNDENQYSEEVVDENRELSDEEKAELMKKYDSESNTRNMKGIAGAIVFILLLSFSIFQLYTGAFGQFTAYIQRTVHLGFALTLIFMLYPARKT